MVMRALDIAEGRKEVIENSWDSGPTKTVVEDADIPAPTAGSSGDINETIIAIVQQMDEGKGVDLETILNACVSRGFEKDLTEPTLDQLVDEGVLDEPRFSWFSIA